MATTRKTWVYRPARPATTVVPDAVKADVSAQARDLVETVLKPRHIEPPPDDERFNYIVDIDTKWYRDYFYFFAIYRSPGPTAIRPSFEAKFARLRYRGANSFSLAFMRHTGQWIEPYADLTLAQCLEMIRDDPSFVP
jgi:hypothetical protein